MKKTVINKKELNKSIEQKNKILKDNRIVLKDENIKSQGHESINSGI